MNYACDVILNWSENEILEFYEWDDTDPLELIKKIPIFKVKHKVFLDLFSNISKVNMEFLMSIKDKTIISGKNIVNKIPYAAIFTDNKSVVALEFNYEGVSTNYSKLLIEDELNVLELAYALKETDLALEIIKPLKKDCSLRQEREAKALIELELDSLYEKKDTLKLKYLYYEYKREKEDNIDIIYNTLKEHLTKELNGDILKLYYIIKLSYHNV